MRGRAGGNHIRETRLSSKYSPIPVIIGVGQVNDRGETSETDSALDSLGLMQAALRAADEDAGGGWLARLDSLGVVDQISFPQLGDVSLPLADLVGASPRFCYKSGYASGDSPLLLLNEAANRIGAGGNNRRGGGWGRGSAHRGSPGGARRERVRGAGGKCRARGGCAPRALLSAPLRIDCACGCVSSVRKCGTGRLPANAGAGSGRERGNLVAVFEGGRGKSGGLAAAGDLGRRNTNRNPR